MNFISPTYGKVDEVFVKNFLVKTIKCSENHNYKVIVGTDSQNFHKTKMVLVVCLIDEGRGGRFFYNIEWLPKIKDLNTKIYTETQKSLNFAKELNEEFFRNEISQDVEIHVDIGKDGKTKNLIQGIIGWVHAEGFGTVKIKDQSYVASTIADKISK